MADSYSIQITSKLIDKLGTDESKVKKKTKRPKLKASQESKQVDSKPEPFKNEETKNQFGRWTPTSPLIGPTVVAELEPIRSVLRESEKIKEKLENHEANMSKEIADRAKELQEKEFRLPHINPVPCTAEREACLNCYKENWKNPLKCAKMVKSFSSCALLAARQ